MRQRRVRVKKHMQSDFKKLVKVKVKKFLYLSLGSAISDKVSRFGRLHSE